MWSKLKEQARVIWGTHQIWIIAQIVTISMCICMRAYLHVSPKISVSKPDDHLQVSEFASGSDSDKNLLAPDKQEKSKATTEEWFVDVKGAVNKPGIYPINNGKRVIDALNLAGGPRADADIQQINRATKVSDEMVIEVPIKRDDQPSSETEHTSHITDTKSTLINLNKASETELMSLPGVGQKRAQDIIGYREEQPFSSINDLGKVPGIGPKMLAKLTPLVCV